VNYLRGVFGLGSVRSGRSRAFGLWSKYFAGISDSRGLGIRGSEGGGKGSRIIVAIIFRLLLRRFFPRSITRSFLVISA
jgi:hypothetical protein